LLVILSGAFSNTTSFPQQVGFTLPPGARGIQATQEDATGQLLSQPWQVVDGKLTYALPGPQFQVEYYLDRQPSGTTRELSYDFEAPFAIQALEISVQQPARSSGFSVSPQPEGSSQGGDGLTYYRIRRTKLQAGDRIPVVIRYTKTDQGLSAPPSSTSSTGAASGGTLGAATPAPQASSTWLPWVLIGIGLTALAAAAVYWYLGKRGQGRAGTRPAPAVGRRPSYERTAQAESRAGKEPVPATAAFCTQCGHRLRPGDRFCAQCGAPQQK
jgi:hypothetical protein